MVREGEMPAMVASVYGSSAAHTLGGDWSGGAITTNATNWVETPSSDPHERNRIMRQMLIHRPTVIAPAPTKGDTPVATNKDKLRIVRIFLVDPDEKIPLDKRMLYKTDEMTTDLDDRELFFELPVVELLKTHNKLRQAIMWKEPGSKGDAEPLKEIRIRDLVMSVTTIAEFALR